jgi:hypothetical protein
MHGIGEFRYNDGAIYKGCWTNDNRNGTGLFWYPDGDLYQGNYKDSKWDGLQIIHYKATGVTADAEYQDGLLDGLYAEYTSNGIIWRTYSKD